MTNQDMIDSAVDQWSITEVTHCSLR